jgi:beta-galactosidase GanA
MPSQFRYGASYSPLIFPEADWDRDLAQMQDAGMNLIRLGDVHGSWDVIEPAPGQYQLAQLGRFYQRAAEFGIDILISTGASGPPLWLAREYPDLPLLNSRGERYPLGASYHWACIHHPGYRDALTKYIHALLGFTKEQPNHFGWQITNEIGFPFLPPRGEGNLGLFCYCDHCQALFRDWAREKYGDLDALTKAWAWGTTYYVYNDWDDVFPPESPPSAWASVTRWLDWRLFWQAAFADFAGWQNELIKSEDPDHPTSVNTFNFKGYDRFGVFTGLDQWQLAQAVDHIGYDLYPGSGNKLATRPEHTSIFLDHGRSVANTTGRDFWLHEVESGPIGGWVMGPDHNTDAADIEQYCVESLGHDAKLMLYMPWREWDYQPLHWGALVDLDGNPTPRLAAAAKIGKWIKAHEADLMMAHVPQAEAAILESKKNAIFFRGVDQDEELFLAQRGAYRALWEQGYGVDFINPDLAQDGTIKRYQQVILPMMGLIERETAEALVEYVHEGGLLVGFARCGTLDENGWFYHHWPCASLGAAFGIETIEPDTLEGQMVHFAGKQYSAHWNRDLLALKPGTEVLATFDDGRPAVTLAKYGKGYGLYIATQADSGSLATEQPILKDILAFVQDQVGLSPRIRVLSPAGGRPGVDPHLLDLPGRTYLLVTDYLHRDKEIKLVLKDQRRIDRICQVYPEEVDADGIQQGDQLTLTCQSEAKEVKIFQIDWA